MKKLMTSVESREFGNGQAVVEWVAIAALVLGVCAAGFAALGTQNDALLDTFTAKISDANNALNASNVTGSN